MNTESILSKADADPDLILRTGQASPHIVTIGSTSKITCLVLFCRIGKIWERGGGFAEGSDGFIPTCRDDSFFCSRPDKIGMAKEVINSTPPKT